MPKSLLFFLVVLLPLVSISQETKTVVIPPSKDTAKIRITTTTVTTTDYKVDYVPVSGSNKPPIANAGPDVAITLPANTVTLSASNSSDADGSIASYKWTQVSGGSANIIQVNTTINVSGLTQGVYVFRVTVTDNGGLSDNDEVQVNVNPAPNQPSAGYSLSYSNDYEQASDINSNQLGIGKWTIFEGRGVFWSEYKPGGAQVSSGFRSEQEYNLRYFPQANPVEGKLSVEMYFKDYKVQGRVGHCLQWHPNNNRSALFLLGHTEGKFNFARSIDGSNFYQSGNLKVIESNKWYKVEIEFKWSGGSDGYLRAYVDGVLCMSYTGRTQDSSGQPYLKVGQNYFNSGVGGIVLYDNLNVFKKI